jgi:hypothetical protein
LCFTVLIKIIEGEITMENYWHHTIRGAVKATAAIVLGGLLFTYCSNHPQTYDNPDSERTKRLKSKVELREIRAQERTERVKERHSQSYDIHIKIEESYSGKQISHHNTRNSKLTNGLETKVADDGTPKRVNMDDLIAERDKVDNTYGTQSQNVQGEGNTLYIHPEVLNYNTANPNVRNTTKPFNH